jgi:hypothetical protein
MLVCALLFTRGNTGASRGAIRARGHAGIFQHRGEGRGMNTVSIQKDPPRDPAHYGSIDMWHNLKGNFYSAGAFGAIGLLLLASLALGPYDTGVVVFIIIVASVLLYASVRSVWKSVRIHDGRVQAFIAGAVCRGEVVSHGGTIVVWRLNRFYTLIVQLRTPEGKVLEKKIRSEDASMHAAYPLHDEIDVLADFGSGTMFVPPETGISAVFE